MINIEYSTREPPSLTVKGHSGYSTIGTDIVCAGVSTLFNNLVNSLSEFTDDLVSVRCSPGDGAIIWKGHVSTTARLLLNSHMLGMKDIAETYPEYVTYKVV